MDNNARIVLGESFNPGQIYDYRSNFLFARNVELRDHNNQLETFGGECTLIAFLTDGVKGKKLLNLVRFYGLEK